MCLMIHDKNHFHNPVLCFVVLIPQSLCSNYIEPHHVKFVSFEGGGGGGIHLYPILNID